MTDILQEASELINGQRAKDYGDVTDNFQRIADLWQTYLDGIHPINKIDCHDVAMMMILVKVARQLNGYHRDSVVDIAGYAALAEKVAQSSAPVSEDFWDDIDQSIVEAQEKRERDRTQKPPLPRVWESLDDVPDEVDVFDTGYRIWYVREGYGERYWRSGDIPIVWERPAMQGPFTECLDIEQKGSE